MMGGIAFIVPRSGEDFETVGIPSISPSDNSLNPEDQLTAEHRAIFPERELNRWQPLNHFPRATKGTASMLCFP